MCYCWCLLNVSLSQSVSLKMGYNIRIILESRALIIEIKLPVVFMLLQ